MGGCGFGFGFGCGVWCECVVCAWVGGGQAIGNQQTSVHSLGAKLFWEQSIEHYFFDPYVRADRSHLRITGQVSSLFQDRKLGRPGVLLCP